MHDMHIADATRDDAQALAHLLCQAGLGLWDDLEDPANALAHWDRMKAALPTSRVMVLQRCDKTILATLTLVTLPMLGFAGAPSALIEDFAVMPQMHRNGMGRLLLNAALAAARQAGCYKVALSAHVGPGDALTFFEHMGFERHGASLTLKLMPVMDDESEDELPVVN